MSAPAKVHSNSVTDKDILSLVNEAYTCLKDDNPDKALRLYKEAASMITENPPKEELIPYVKSLNNIGYIYLFLKNDPEQAYPYLLRAKKIASQEGFNDLMGGILDNLAKIQNDFGDAKGAIDTYTSALQYAVTDSTDVSGVIQLMIFNDLLSCAMANDFQSEITPSIDLFDRLPQYDIPMGKYTKEVSRAMREMLSGNLAVSTSILQNCTPLINSNVDKTRYLVDHLLMIATIYDMREMPDSAMTHIVNAHVIATENNLIDKLPRINRGIGTIFKDLGQNDEANKWFLRAHEIDDSLHTATTYARIRTLEPTLDIDLLQKEMRLAEDKHRTRLSVIWALSAAFSLISLLLILLLIRNRKLKNSYGELVSKHKESIRQSEAASRIRHEYEETIRKLQNTPSTSYQENSSDATLSIQKDDPKEIQPKGISMKTVSDTKVQLPISNEERLRIIGAVNDVMEQSPETTNPDFSLDRLSELVNTKPRYLSAILNESIGKSFSQLLAEYRVKEACKMLLSPNFKKTMTVESVSFAVGYKSRTQFTTIFKRITGLTPSQYVSVSK